jgi:SNF2 family DNA or RNA helicase
MNKPLIIQGRHSFKQRASIVDKFNKDPNHRVLIFSKVGSTGLNLTRASIVIFLVRTSLHFLSNAAIHPLNPNPPKDQPWSAQDEWQIIGRAYRQRQSKPVTVIQLLAANTADITLSLLARGKKDMLDAFFGLDTETSRCASQFTYPRMIG